MVSAGGTSCAILASAFTFVFRRAVVLIVVLEREKSTDLPMPSL
jgi:hypothetical protein